MLDGSAVPTVLLRRDLFAKDWSAPSFRDPGLLPFHSRGELLARVLVLSCSIRKSLWQCLLNFAGALKAARQRARAQKESQTRRTLRSASPGLTEKLLLGDYTS